LSRHCRKESVYIQDCALKRLPKWQLHISAVTGSIPVQLLLNKPAIGQNVT
jgi:hypothetical protein